MGDTEHAQDAKDTLNFLALFTRPCAGYAIGCTLGSMSAYIPTIGLEIHAELKTRTKMFCNSKNDPDEVRPNVNVCPVCMGFPGTLPVPNYEALRHVLSVGVAVGGALADYTEFDRKNYFYPDLPKGYQISQYKYPLVKGGALAGVELTRIHLEEDTARSQHLSRSLEKKQDVSSTPREDTEWSIIDFNRSGIPLMELVTEPVIHDAKTASFFAQELQRLLRTLSAGEANMEKGQMRVEANISICKDSAKFGTKVEVKNINSFKAVEKAIAYEIERQENLLDRGESVVQETRGWDENKGVTFSQRAKENSDGYRYFPEPDIPKFKLSRIAEFSTESLCKSMPELPWQKRSRYILLGLKETETEILVADQIYADFFDAEILKHLKAEEIQIGSNYLLSDIRGFGAGESELKNIRGGKFAEVISLLGEGVISSRGAKDLLAGLLKDGGNPREEAGKRGLLQIQDSTALSGIADQVIRDNEKVSVEVKKGKIEGIKFLIGQGMKKSKGTANPSELERILKQKLGIE